MPCGLRLFAGARNSLLRLLTRGRSSTSERIPDRAVRVLRCMRLAIERMARSPQRRAHRYPPLGCAGAFADVPSGGSSRLGRDPTKQAQSCCVKRPLRRALQVEVNEDRPENVRGKAAHHVQYRRAPKYNPTKTTGRLACGGVCRVTGTPSQLKLRRNCVHVREVAGNQHARHDEYPMLVMRHRDQPRSFREDRGNRCAQSEQNQQRTATRNIAAYPSR